MEPSSAVNQVDGEHRQRARSLSELYNKMLSKRRISGPPKSLDEYLQDLDLATRTAEHVGACKAMNEMRVALWPDKPVEAPPATPSAQK